MLLRISFEEFCRFLPLKDLYSRDFPTTIHHCLSLLRVLGALPQAFTAINVDFASSLEGDLFHLNR